MTIKIIDYIGSLKINDDTTLQTVLPCVSRFYCYVKCRYAECCCVECRGAILVDLPVVW
jgi:hypothetical protein